MISRIILIICLVIICLGDSIAWREAKARELEINASFYVLIDLSKSFFEEKTKTEMAHTLDQVNVALLELSRRHPSPAIFSFLPINEISLGSKPICTAVLRATVFGGGKSGNLGGIAILKKRKQLENFLNQCRDIVLLQKTKMFTDIFGAVDLASRMAKGQSRGTKTMIIISDFFEDRLEGASTPELNLRGFKIGLIYGFRGAKAINPKPLDENVKAMRERLLKAGAEKAEAHIEDGVLTQFIINELSP